MRLLLLGGLGPYPERFQTFLEQGHALWYASTHYLPSIRHQIADIPAFSLAEEAEAGLDQLLELIQAERIEAVYSLLNMWDGSNQATAALLRRGCPVPVARHYKEHYLAPSDDERTCIEESQGVIFINQASREYFASLYRQPAHSICLDADLIPRRYLSGALQPKLSSLDDQPHLLIAGSAMDDGGRYDYRDLMRDSCDRGAHVHLYGQFRVLQPSTGWLVESPEVESSYRTLAEGSDYLHIHDPIPPTRFVEEWSRYDAGLLHAPDSADRFRPFNLPNRYSAYIAAGVPVALATGEMPSLQDELEALSAAVVYEDLTNLVERLPDHRAAAGALAARESVTFEAIFPALVGFIRSCLAE